MSDTEATSDQLGLALLPDLPGKVHGIVQLDPYVRIQCDGCGFIHDGKPGHTAVAILTAGIRFSRRYWDPQNPDRRRLCRACRAVEWTED